MTASIPSSSRVIVDGKFFRLKGQKFYLRGITYGPFAPSQQNEMFASREQTNRDFIQICELGANLLRVYHVPPKWLLDLAGEHELKVLIDIAWPKHLCFLDSEELQEEARKAVRDAVAACNRHPAVFAYSVANEIPAEIVRWSGARKVEAFIDELADEAKAVDPDCLCTFGNFPPTEFLRPQSIDFVCFNVYLHQRKSFEAYLARLQMLADIKPLVLGEFGMDSLGEGEEHQAKFLSWQIESAFRGGLAGTIAFSFTDDWWRGGLQIEDWAFGLTTRHRETKESFLAVRKAYRAAPHFPLPRYPKVSVVVASYNGGKTLDACLESLGRLNYPQYEMILVDDGSTDDTPEILSRFPNVRAIRQENLGLSAARNAGIAAATGEIVAFTDSDCRTDEDWLHYLVSDLLNSECVGIGGHNLLPPDDSCVAAAVMVSPGGPAHVMLTDREAEHIPGCNMAFYKWALEEIGGFDAVFRKAGDDVDVCWRLQQRGHKLGFSPAGFVWHHRRSTVKAYLQQQNGYGEAEALLSRKHPEYFNSFGSGIWRGRIYTPSKLGIVLQRSVIYHGVFGSGFFQRLYSPAPSMPLMLCTSLEYHALVSAPLVALSIAFSLLWPVAIASFVISFSVCVAAAAQAELPPRKQRFWSRPLVAALFFMQPIERGLARYRWRLNGHSSAPKTRAKLTARRVGDWQSPETVAYWSKGGVDRYALLSAILKKLDEQAWQTKTDTGWINHDIEIFGNRWCRLRLTTVTEELALGRRSFHCRLQPAWSLQAKVLFWSLAVVDSLIIAFLASVEPWIWMLLLTLPLLSLWFEYHEDTLRQNIASVIEEAAAPLKLLKLDEPAQPGSRTAPSAELCSNKEQPEPTAAGVSR